MWILKAIILMIVSCVISVEAKDKLLLKAYDLAAKVKSEQNKIRLESLTFEMIDPQNWRSPEEIRNKSVIALTTITTTYAGVRSVRIFLSEDLRYVESAILIQAIFHELAHAYDTQCSNGSMHDARYVQNLYYYSAIKDDAQQYIDDLRERLGWHEDIHSYEWYAEWQSLQWMKKYTPEVVEKFKKHLRERIAQEKKDFISSYHYPPATLLMKWIS